MRQKSACDKSDIGILNDILIEYVFSKAYIRVFSVSTIFTTFAACCFNVQVSDAAKSLTDSIKGGDSLAKSLLFFSLITIMATTLTELSSYMFTAPVQRVYRLTARNVFENFLKMNLSEYNQIGCGEIQVIVDRESKAISELIEVIFLNIIPIIFTLALSVCAIVIHLGLVYILIILLTILIYIITTIIIVHWRTKIRYDYNVAQQVASNTLHDSLINHETILAYKTEEVEAIKYNNTVGKVEYECNRLWRSLSFLFLVNKLIFSLQSFLVIIVGAYKIFTSKLTESNLVFYLSMNRTLFSSFGRLGFFYSRYTQAILNVRTAFKPTSTQKDTDASINFVFTESINMHNVSLSYNGRQIFDKINLTIKKGEKVAVIGRNGAGKTSFLQMIMRYRVYDGEIMIDNTNVSNISTSEYRKLISYISQNSFLFSESVDYNIKYGAQDVCEEEILKLCGKLNLLDSIQRLENQKNTHVGSRGSKLSGGERQKILLLRALLKSSEIFVLDEPTSALDKNAEYDILHYLLTKNTSLTVIVSLHNLELLRMFDKIIHIKNTGINVIPSDDKVAINDIVLNKML